MASVTPAVKGPALYEVIPSYS